jgi:O-methyltransferase
MTPSQLLTKFPIISDQIDAPAMGVVLRELVRVLAANISGDIVELGCYIGTTSLFIRRLLDQEDDATRSFHVYDSFEGLPPKSASDQSGAGLAFQAGELRVSKKDFLQEFRKANLQAPVIHKGWFEDLTKESLPNSIAFAFLDGDFYDSILTSLRLIWPRLSINGRITIDDYDREALPGVSRAVTEFFRTIPVTIHHEQHIAIIQKKDL